MSLDEVQKLAASLYQTTLYVPEKRSASQPDFFLRAALAELHRRMGPELMDWVESAEGDSRYGQLFRLSLGIILAADPSSADRWIRRYQDQGDLIRQIIGEAVLLEAVTYQTGALLEVMRENPGAELKGPFPDGFDFGAVYSAIKADGRQKELIRNEEFVSHWAARDREGVWATVRADAIAAKYVPGLFAGLIQGVVARDGEAAGMRWIMDRWEEMPPELRAGNLDVLRTDAMLSMDGYGPVLARLPEKQSREVAMMMANSDGCNTETIRDVLAHVSRPAMVNAIASVEMFSIRDLKRLNRGIPLGAADRQYVVPDEK